MSSATVDNRVLILDVDFQRLEVAHWKKAITDLFLGKVEVVEFSRDRTIRSVSTEHRMPSVVRLLRRFKRDRRSVKFSRMNIYARDCFTCCYCHREFFTEDLNLDHVVPRSQGGKTCWENIVTCCIQCNSEKANRTPEQAGLKLLRKPRKPHWLPAVSVDMGRHRIPEEWLPYWTVTLER
jgi:5-methylcytosine-specific restriction endonuclease McrA